MDLKQAVQSSAAVLEIDVEHLVEPFEAYFAMLVQWNEKVNLTSLTTVNEAAVKHFVDSLTPLVAHGFPEKGTLGVDVGSGAGFPGMVLAMAVPTIRVVLLDSLEKRCEFLRQVARELKVGNVEIVHSRAEDYGRGKGRGAHDWAIARAVARLPVLSEYCLPLCKVGGVFVAMKGPEGEVEVSEAAKALELLGGEVMSVEKVTLSDGSQRRLVYIRKTRETPPKYPRKAGTPARQPL